MTSYSVQITLNGQELLMVRAALKRFRDQEEARLAGQPMNQRLWLRAMDRVARYFPSEVTCPYHVTFGEIEMGWVRRALEEYQDYWTSRLETEPDAACSAIATIESILERLFPVIFFPKGHLGNASDA